MQSNKDLDHYLVVLYKATKPGPGFLTELMPSVRKQRGEFQHRLDLARPKGSGCSLNIVFFPFNFVIFLSSASSTAALVFYRLACVHTLTPRENRERDRNIIKKPQYLMNTLYV